MSFELWLFQLAETSSSNPQQNLWPEFCHWLLKTLLSDQVFARQHVTFTLWKHMRTDKLTFPTWHLHNKQEQALWISVQCESWWPLSSVESKVNPAIIFEEASFCAWRAVYRQVFSQTPFCSKRDDGASNTGAGTCVNLKLFILQELVHCFIWSCAWVELLTTIEHSHTTLQSFECPTARVLSAQFSPLRVLNMVSFPTGVFLFWCYPPKWNISEKLQDTLILLLASFSALQKWSCRRFSP